MCDNAADIVFDYRQKVTRSFEYLQGDYYIAPVFMVSCFSVLIVIVLTNFEFYCYWLYNVAYVLQSTFMNFLLLCDILHNSIY